MQITYPATVVNVNALDLSKEMKNNLLTYLGVGDSEYYRWIPLKNNFIMADEFNKILTKHGVCLNEILILDFSGNIPNVEIEIIGFQSEKHIIHSTNMYYIHAEDYYGESGYIRIYDGANKLITDCTKATVFRGSSLDQDYVKNHLKEFLRFKFIDINLNHLKEFLRFKFIDTNLRANDL